MKKDKTPRESSYNSYHVPITDVILDHIEAGFVFYDHDWKLVYINKSGAAIIGRKPQEIIGKTIWDIFPEFRNSSSEKKYLNAVKTGRKLILEEYLEKLNRWFYVRVYPNNTGITVTFQDITQRKNAEMERDQLISVVETSTDAFWSCDSEGRILSWNNGAKSIYGYSAHEVIGKRCDIIVPKDKREEFHKKITRIFQDKKVAHHETQRINKEGTIIDVSVSMSPIKNATGKIVAVSIIGRDITKQKQIENIIKFNEQRYRTIIEKSFDAIVLLSKEGKRLYATPTISKILGYSAQDHIGEDTFTKVHPDDRKRMKEVLAEVTKSPHASITTEWRVLDKAGKFHWLEGTLSNFLDDPIINAVIANYHDITKRKMLEKQKDEFLSVASHELKTPVTSLKAFNQVLQSRFSKTGDQQAVLLLGKMDTQINKLTALIQDLLDVSNLEHDKLQLNNSIFNFDSLVQETVEAVGRTTTKHTLKIKGKTHKKLTADQDRITQVITNFLTNAIKYSPNAHEILIHLSGNENEVTLCVEDFGVGVPDQDLPLVFERFFRVSKKSHNTIPGIGLGLNIASEIIKSHGGKIWAENKKGKGSKFYFSLPITQSENI